MTKNSLVFSSVVAFSVLYTQSCQKAEFDANNEQKKNGIQIVAAGTTNEDVNKKTEIVIKIPEKPEISVGTVAPVVTVIPSPTAVATTIPLITLCTEEPKPLPKGLTGLKEVWNWKGPTSKELKDYVEYKQVVSSPMVGLLIGNTSSVVFSAYTRAGFTSLISVPNIDAIAGRVFAISGVDGKELWMSDLKSDPLSSVAIGDTNGDNLSEVIAQGIDGYVYALNGQNGKQIWKSSVPVWQTKTKLTGMSIGYHIAIADVNFDKNAEILVNGHMFNAKDGVLKYKIAKDTEDTQYKSGNDGVIAALNKNTPDLEIAFSHGIYSAGDGKKICDYKFKQPLWGIAEARLKKDDTSRTIVGLAFKEGEDVKDPHPTNMIYLINGETCETRAEIMMPDSTGGPINLADVDGDGDLEISLASRNKYLVFKSELKSDNKLELKLLWDAETDDKSSGKTGSTAFDFNGDGKTEIIYNDEKFLRIFDGAKGTVLYEVKNSSATLLENPIIVDADGDNHANIIVAANIYDYSNNAFGENEGVRMFSDPNNEWVNTRKIWNQHSYNVVNVGNKGEIININDKSIWKEIIIRRQLLGFRNNLSILPKTECK